MRLFFSGPVSVLSSPCDAERKNRHVWGKAIGLEGYKSRVFDAWVLHSWSLQVVYNKVD